MSKFGTARVATLQAARAHFADGGSVTVSVHGESSFRVGALTTTHSQDRGTWEGLCEVVQSYGDRRQRFYIVTWSDCIMAGRVAQGYTFPVDCHGDSVDMFHGYATPTRACGMHSTYFESDVYAARRADETRTVATPA